MNPECELNLAARICRHAVLIHILIKTVFSNALHTNLTTTVGVSSFVGSIVRVSVYGKQSVLDGIRVVNEYIFKYTR